MNPDFSRRDMFPHGENGRIVCATDRCLGCGTGISRNKDTYFKKRYCALCHSVYMRSCWYNHPSVFSAMDEFKLLWKAGSGCEDIVKRRRISRMMGRL